MKNSPPSSQAEPWLRGPLEGVQALLMPAAHALVQSKEDLAHHARKLTTDQLWAELGGAPSVAFHLRHIAGSIERLLTYAAGHALSEQQLQRLADEVNVASSPQLTLAVLLKDSISRIDDALAVVRSTDESKLLHSRTVGRAALPTNVLGLLFHIAEHTQRHTGQAIATATIVRGL